MDFPLTVFIVFLFATHAMFSLPAEKVTSGKNQHRACGRRSDNKKLVKGPGYYVLQPDSTNAKNRPIIVAQDCRVQAVVCRVFKKEQCFECCDERLFS
jgi:hypothetical protein